jgi:hypothetical protein
MDKGRQAAIFEGRETDTGMNTYADVKEIFGDCTVGTDRIDLQPATEAYRYSSWTYGSGSPATIVVYL